MGLIFLRLVGPPYGDAGSDRPLVSALLFTDRLAFPEHLFRRSKLQSVSFLKVRSCHFLHNIAKKHPAFLSYRFYGTTLLG